MMFGQHLCPAFAKAHRPATATALHLAHKENPYPDK